MGPQPGFIPGFQGKYLYLSQALRTILQIAITNSASLVYVSNCKDLNHLMTVISLQGPSVGRLAHAVLPRVIASPAHAPPAVCLRCATERQPFLVEPVWRLQRRLLTSTPAAVSSTAAPALAEEESAGAPEAAEQGFARDFSERYELLQPLQSGAFKTTHLGRCRATDARVAVGVLAKYRAGSTLESNMRLIQQEVRSESGKLLPFTDVWHSPELVATVLSRCAL